MHRTPGVVDGFAGDQDWVTLPRAANTILKESGVTLRVTLYAGPISLFSPESLHVDRSAF
jgi:hypothetical protein